MVIVILGIFFHDVNHSTKKKTCACDLEAVEVTTDGKEGQGK